MKEISLDAKKTLTQILGITLALKHKKSGSEQAPLIKQLATHTRRLDHTIADLVEADKLAHGDVDLHVRRTDVQALVQRIIEESDFGSEHELVVDTERLVVAVDPIRTEQIIAGLLRGAIERSPDGSPITVKLDHEEGGALIAVEDAEASSDASLSPVVSRFAEAQGGWAKVEGRLGGGSSFKVFLPDGSSPVVSTEDAAGGTSDQDSDVEIVVEVESPAEEEDEPGWPEAAGKLLVQELQKLSREE
jgi:K+-sensing histidine kinase KdpD